ncbi:MAG TPA: hypothetical protein VJ276_04215 [Thermoanaerobaculia bacterium]|nr:hypothetical protein [Thermoanaerobaculia bacterium]
MVAHLRPDVLEVLIHELAEGRRDELGALRPAFDLRAEGIEETFRVFLGCDVVQR